MTRGYSLALILAGLFASAPACAADAKHGAVIAKRWCAACHVVASDQQSASADVPPFADIARRRDPRDLAVFLADPHPKMPDMNLSRGEIDDIVAYIRSLDPRSAPPGEPERAPNG